MYSETEDEKNKTHKEIRDIFRKELTLSFQNLVEQAAAENRELVIAKNGKPVLVKASLILKQLKTK